MQDVAAGGLEIDHRPRLRVEMAAQPRCGEKREPQGQRLAPGRWQPLRDTVAQHGRAEPVCHDQATFFGDQKPRKVARNREKKPVGKFFVTGPFTIGPEVGHRAFDLDDDEVAGLAEREDVGTASICEREFEQTGIAELFERPAGAPRQQRGASRFGV